MLESGSFRDRSSRVFYLDDEVYRALDEEAYTNWKLLSDSRFFKQFTKIGKIVVSEETALPSACSPEPLKFKAYLKHTKIPVISYPFEWCFAMLKEAACLHIELMQAALSENMIIKDASAYNIQWQDLRPVLVDVASFEPYQAGQAWTAYEQFCRMFLYPLMLKAYRNVDFQTIMRGNLEGVPLRLARGVFSFTDVFKPGVSTHILLQSLLSSQAVNEADLPAEIKQAGFSKDLITSNLKKLGGLIQKLKTPELKSAWSRYEQTAPYTAADKQAKQEFVSKIAAARNWECVWDLGCNTGNYSRMFQAHSNLVLALDSDPLSLDLLYRERSEAGKNNILPLVFNLADPTPALGWKHLERKTLEERSQADLILALALVHHLVITHNIPLGELIDWLAAQTAAILIEFIPLSDPMAQVLLKNKRNQYAELERDNFKRLLTTHFAVQLETLLPDSGRTLYYACRA